MKNLKKSYNQNSFRRLGTGEDVSNCVAFLASDMANYIKVKPYMLMVECIWLDNSINNLIRNYHN